MDTESREQRLASEALALSDRLDFAASLLRRYGQSQTVAHRYSELARRAEARHSRRLAAWIDRIGAMVA